ncbi:predicted protein [Histoplasma capsulatum G186AR]|uniref:Uncharacterized protein n=1 Tax=Ajellomyces capsulatus (strain G186AR / H82 / ATCC MYA-2454 / RMSCC 2432) TaxID=447093 RepID=C0NMH3_AJECG|nr:uncharacterized protein HCBG_03950 [Histoplasma capsulatum G186AR]EEH07071.1 predicted protein [Histoplasma capsulatum G186AR]
MASSSRVKCETMLEYGGGESYCGALPASMCNGFVSTASSASTRLNPNPRPGASNGCVGLVPKKTGLPKVAKASSNAHRAAGDFPIGRVPVLLICKERTQPGAFHACAVSQVISGWESARGEKGAWGLQGDPRVVEFILLGSF